MCLTVCYLAGGLVCDGACGCCKLACGSFKQQVRLSYVMLFCFCIFVLFIINWIQPFLDWFTIFGISCPNTGDTSCLGASVIYRMSFVLALMHIFILLACTCRSEFSQNVNEKVWALKILFIIGLFIATLWIPNSFFQVYSIIAMVFSVLFLLFQIVMVIDLCYLWNEAWIEAYDRGEKCYANVLIGFTVVIYGGFLTLTVYEYIWFSGCGYGTAATTITLLLALVVTILPLTRINPKGSIFTSSTVSMFACYLTWVGLSNMSADCNSAWKDKTKATVIYMVTGGIITLISLIYVTFGSSKKSSGNTKVAGNIDIAKGVLEDGNDENEKGDSIELGHKKVADTSNIQDTSHQVNESRVEKGKLSDYQKSNGYIYFHLIMFCAAFYMSMLLTNWGNADAGGRTFSFNYDSDAASWFMIGCSWITLLLYAWTIIAPRVCQGRDFEQKRT